MPLLGGESERALKANVRTEIKAGRPTKQAVAIAYAQRRRAHVRIPGRTRHPSAPEHDSILKQHQVTLGY